MFKSETYGTVTNQKMYDIIKQRLAGVKDFTIAVGTDSQSYTGSNVVMTVVVHISGKGGFFFWKHVVYDRFHNLHQKIYAETQHALDVAAPLKEFLKEHNLSPENLQVHPDIGKNGPTAKLIKEITGWVTSMGYVCKIKPESYASSTVADRKSKRSHNSRDKKRMAYQVV